MTSWIVADDLTGACDAAVAFTARSMSVSVLLASAQGVENHEIAVLSTETRDVPVEYLSRKLRLVFDRLALQDREFLFKKIDSIFRGNTLAELAEWMDLMPQKFAVLAPAYPALGRQTRGGRLFVQDIAGESELDLAQGLDHHGLEYELLEDVSHMSAGVLAAKMIAACDRGKRLALCDTETAGDLSAIVEAGYQSGLDILWIGSGGLAHALAAKMPLRDHAWREQRKKGPIVFCIGSDHAVSLLQMRFLKSKRACCEICIGPDSGEHVRESLRAGTDVLLRIPRKEFESESIAAVLLQLQWEKIGALLVSGGDTAAMVCRVLKVEVIEVRGEQLPGIPWGVIRGGIADGLTFITKSGCFGDENALVESTGQFCVEARETA